MMTLKERIAKYNELFGTNVTKLTARQEKALDKKLAKLAKANQEQTSTSVEGTGQEVANPNDSQETPPSTGTGEVGDYTGQNGADSSNGTANQTIVNTVTKLLIEDVFLEIWNTQVKRKRAKPAVSITSDRFLDVVEILEKKDKTLVDIDRVYNRKAGLKGQGAELFNRLAHYVPKHSNVDLDIQKKRLLIVETVVAIAKKLYGETLKNKTPKSTWTIDLVSIIPVDCNALGINPWSDSLNDMNHVQIDSIFKAILARGV